MKRKYIKMFENFMSSIKPKLSLPNMSIRSDIFELQDEIQKIARNFNIYGILITDISGVVQEDFIELHYNFMSNDAIIFRYIKNQLITLVYYKNEVSINIPLEIKNMSIEEYDTYGKIEISKFNYSLVVTQWLDYIFRNSIHPNILKVKYRIINNNKNFIDSRDKKRLKIDTFNIMKDLKRLDINLYNDIMSIISDD